MQSKRCLILTGTIIPNSNYVAVSDPLERAESYRQALEFYIENCSLPIVFIENSEFGLSEAPGLETIVNHDRIEFLRFPKSDKVSEGKGYQEFQMLDQAIEQLAEEYHDFVKITGRYQVRNIGRIVRLKTDGLLADAHKKMGVIQTTCFMCTTHFYQTHIQGAFQEVNDDQGRYIEKVLYERLKGSTAWNQCALFPFNPLIEGVSGSHGGDTGRHPLKMKLRNLERKLLRMTGAREFKLEY